MERKINYESAMHCSSNNNLPSLIFMNELWIIIIYSCLVGILICFFLNLLKFRVMVGVGHANRCMLYKIFELLLFVLGLSLGAAGCCSRWVSPSEQWHRTCLVRGLKRIIHFVLLSTLLTESIPTHDEKDNYYFGLLLFAHWLQFKNTHFDNRLKRSRRYCDVRIAYKYGSAHEFSG